MTAAVLVALLGVGSEPPAGAKPAAEPASARDALRPFNLLVGSWKGTGTPEGTRDERAAGLWTETDTWGWQFKGQDVCLTATFDKGKHYSRGELRYSAEKRAYQLDLTAADETTATFTGALKDKVLTLDRADPPAGEDQRLVVTLLHHNRHLVRFEARPAGSKLGFVRKWQVGATKEGVPFADVPKGPECVVSGGLGTMKVTHNGQDYYVCCSGCRDAFKEDPEKFIKEAAAKAKDKK
ncbi:MAG: hypothetical protein K2X87_19500 [Gemmataceae bacterium]|nr:hypothetical protein [Gemmataceae bacterium]